MTVNFNNIPNAIRVPLFYAEVDNSKANTGSTAGRTLMLAPMLATGDATPDVAIQARGGTDARARLGVGSIGASMVDWYRRRDTFGDLWVVPIADAGGGSAATGTITFTGPASAAGTLSLYVAGTLVAVPVAATTAANAIATATAAAINALTDLPVTAGVAGAVVTLTCRHKGLLGNDIDLRMNYRGAAGGEVTPAGVTVVFVAMSGGATNPTLTNALTNLGDAPFDFIISPFNDPTTLSALQATMNDVTGRWAWSKNIFGHVFYAYRGTTGVRTTFGLSRNNQHETALGFYDSPSPVWAWAANHAAAAANSLRADPALPLQTLQLDVLAPPLASRDTLSQRNALLYCGIATTVVGSDGTVSIENLITTYQTNALGQADDSYLQVEKLFTLAEVLRRLRARIATKFGRSKLASNATRLPPGSNTATPNIIRAEIIAQYQELEGNLVEDSQTFAANLIVERDTGNPNRVNVLFPPDLINQLGIIAVLAQFRA